MLLKKKNDFSLLLSTAYGMDFDSFEEIKYDRRHKNGRRQNYFKITQKFKLQLTMYKMVQIGKIIIKCNK